MRRISGAVAVLGMLALAGCGGGDPLPTLPPTPSSTPVFASEEEALAAAEEAYAAYLEAWALIASEGGVNPERIASHAVGEFYEAEIEGFRTLRDNQWRVVGASRLQGAELQFADLEGSQSSAVVAAYLCVDVSGVDVLDTQGASVVSPSRPNLQAFEVTFDLDGDGGLVPSDRSPWEAGSVCTASE